LDLLGVEFQRVLREFETFLNESSEFTDATALLSKDLLSVGRTDDDLWDRIEDFQRIGQDKRTDFSASVCHTDIATRVTLLSQLAGEELIELGAENTVSYELSLFADLSGHFGC